MVVKDKSIWSALHSIKLILYIYCNHVVIEHARVQKHSPAKTVHEGTMRTEARKRRGMTKSGKPAKKRKQNETEAAEQAIMPRA